MKIERKIDSNHDRVVVTVKGRFGFAQFRQIFDSTLEHPDFRANMDILWDLQDATVEANVMDIQRIVRHIYKNRARRGSGYKTAIVVVGSTELAASKLFKLFAGYLPFDTQVFQEREAAVQWLDRSA